jgi:hypothetical protein
MAFPSKSQRSKSLLSPRGTFARCLKSARHTSSGARSVARANSTIPVAKEIYDYEKKKEKKGRWNIFNFGNPYG